MSAETLSKKSKKICASVNCNVCEDAMKAINDNADIEKKQEHYDTVILYMKTIVDTHNKLVKSEKVDQQLISELLLGGIINILNQSEAVDNIIKRIAVIK